MPSRRRDTAHFIGRLAHFFSCSNSRVLLGGIANGYFAIKMPGSVGENRYNTREGETGMKNGSEPINSAAATMRPPERQSEPGSSVPS